MQPYSGLGERSSQTSDSSPQSKTRSTSGNNETSVSGKNPYDFESEEEGEIREPSTEVNNLFKNMPPVEAWNFLRRPKNKRRKLYENPNRLDNGLTVELGHHRLKVRI